jgi:hypothetical protein
MTPTLISDLCANLGSVLDLAFGAAFAVLMLKWGE